MTFSATRIPVFFAMTALVSLKADGRFPYGGLGESAYQGVLLGYTLTFLTLVALWFKGKGPSGGNLDPIPAWVWVAGSQGLFLLVFPLEAIKYRAFGYQWDQGSYGVLVVLSLWVLGVSRRHGRFLWAAGMLYVLGQVLSIHFFPLHPDRSDMLPLIASAVRRALEGPGLLQNPYGHHDVGHVLPLTYLPGLWMAYLPAGLLSVDYRWIHLIATVAALGLLARMAPEGSSKRLLLALFGVIPYLQYRHEIYLGPIFLMVALWVTFMKAGRHQWAGVAYGLLALQSQLFWPGVGVLALFLFKSTTPFRALSSLGLLVGVFLMGVLPFLVGDWIKGLDGIPRGAFGERWVNAGLETPFIQGVFLHWRGVVNLDAMNLAHWVLPVIGTSRLIFVQGLFLMGLLLSLGLRRGLTPADAVGAVALALLIFVLLNPLVWSYFYLIFLFLLLGQALLAEDPWPDRLRK